MMKWVLSFLVFSSLASAAQVNLSSGLVAYYPFNGNAKDESGNHHDPSVTNVSFTADRFGNARSAASFNGTSNYIRIPDHPALHFSKGMSISAWVMINGFYEGKCHGNRIIMKGNDDDNNGNYFLTYDDNHSTNGSNCFTDKVDKKRQNFYAGHISPFKGNYIITGKWCLLTYTYDGRDAFLYLDCKLIGKGSLPGYHFSNNDNLYFGKMELSQYPYWFNGLLDEVRIYNRALATDEILALCNKKQEELVPDITCAGSNTIPAKFDYDLSDCTTASFELGTTQTKKIKTIQWYFGDGGTSNKLAPDHSYKKEGSYKVKAIVTSSSGCTDTFTKEVKFRGLTTDFSFSEMGERGKIQFKAKNNSASYSWDFGDGNTVKRESLASNFYTQAGEYTVRMFALNSSGCRDTVEKKIAVVLPVIITEVTVPKEKEPVVITAPLPATTLEKRDKDIVRTITVDNDSLVVSLYDNGIIDGDSISLIYNNEVILSKQLLGTKPLTLYLTIDPQRSNNELVMYAENLGSIPPNTALMIITDGNNRYEVNVSSNKRSNGAVSFTRKNNKAISSQ
ncbi:MAG TPA: PKD domain-containing protein [Chitinophagaceae bacterium]|jgi:PKD repeat protein|nr:PKD domain-containing protein [Chitinophagaceae bacterium]